MEQIVELNHSLLSKLPLGLQSLLKSLPLSDFSIILFLAIIAGGILYTLLCCGSDTKEEIDSFGEYKREKKEVLVKVNTPNPKKNVKRGKKKKENSANEEKIEEVKTQLPEDKSPDDDWEVVKTKKPKRKDE